MGYRKRFGGRKTVTTPYGKKVPVKAARKKDDKGPVIPPYSWITLKLEDFKDLKAAEKLPNFVLKKLRSAAADPDKEPSVVVNEWFFNANLVLRNPGDVILCADKRSRVVSVIGLYLSSGEIKRPSKLIEFSV